MCKLSVSLYTLGVMETRRRENQLNLAGDQRRPSDYLANSKRVSKASQAKPREINRKCSEAGKRSHMPREEWVVSH